LVVQIEGIVRTSNDLCECFMPYYSLRAHENGLIISVYPIKWRKYWS